MIVGVIGGGTAAEHEVSLASAAAVREGLQAAGHGTQELTIGRDGVWRCRGQRLGRTPSSSLAAALGALAQCDVVFPVLHGPLGEDGALAALCGLADLPLVGCPLGAAALAMDKWATKLVAGAVGVATAPGVLLSAGEAVDRSRLPAGDLVVKPVAAGSSHGVSLVRAGDDLGPAVAAALEYDHRVLVEERVLGREIDVAVVELPHGDLLLGPPLEIVTDGLFSTAAKYDADPGFVIPARLGRAEADRLTSAATAVFRALGCRGIARVDFFVTDDGVPVLNEVNTMPGMTPHSQVPKMFAAIDIPYPQLLHLLVDVAARPVPASGGMLPA